MTTVRWGILGCGDVAEKKGGPALSLADGSELVAVMRRDRDKAEDFARRHGARRFYDNAADLLADPEIDAVYIATPPSSHEELTVEAARAGKHVLVEKPMAIDTKSCEAMLDACERAGVLLHVAYYRRFWPKFVAVKAAIESGAIGTPLAARLFLATTAPTTGWRVDPKVSGGGHTLDVGSHRLDMLNFLFGAPARAHGFRANRLKLHDAENDAVICYRTLTDIVVTTSFHFHTSPSSDTLEVFGSDGTIRCDPFDSPDFTILRRGADRETHSHPTPSPTHLPLIESLVKVYRGETAQQVTGRDALETTRLLDLIRPEIPIS